MCKESRDVVPTVVEPLESLERDTTIILDKKKKFISPVFKENYYSTISSLSSRGSDDKNTLWREKEERKKKKVTRKFMGHLSCAAGIARRYLRPWETPIHQPFSVPMNEAFIPLVHVRKSRSLLWRFVSSRLRVHAWIVPPFMRSSCFSIEIEKEVDDSFIEFANSFRST